MLMPVQATLQGVPGGQLTFRIDIVKDVQAPTESPGPSPTASAN